MKRLSSLFLITIMILSFLTVDMLVVSATELNWQDTGIPEAVLPNADNVFEIYTARQLAWVAKQTESGYNFFGDTIKLMNDINLKGREWTPIGMRTPFAGIFNGNYKKILNLQIGTDENPSSNRILGFISILDIKGKSNAAIYAVGLENVKIVGNNSSSVGALLGTTTMLTGNDVRPRETYIVNPAPNKLEKLCLRNILPKMSRI